MQFLILISLFNIKLTEKTHLKKNQIYNLWVDLDVATVTIFNTQNIATPIYA